MRGSEAPGSAPPRWLTGHHSVSGSQLVLVCKARLEDHGLEVIIAVRANAEVELLRGGGGLEGLADALQCGGPPQHHLAQCALSARPGRGNPRQAIQSG